MKKVFLIVFIILYLISCSNEGTTSTVTTTTSATTVRDHSYLQNLIDNAKEGDIVFIPEGKYNLYETVFINKNLTLKGEGVNKTLIVHYKKDYNEHGISITGKEGSGFRITDIYFKGDENADTNNSNNIFISGNCKNFRIDHCKFEKGGAHSLMVDGDTYGVIDHCEFINDSQESISLRNGNGDDVWSKKEPVGTDKAIFIEDNLFLFETKGTHAVTGVNGARFVFRYNSVKSSINGALVDAHGNFENDRSNYLSEIYNNSLENIHPTIWNAYAIYIRGGLAVISDNIIKGKFSYAINLTNYRSWNSSKRYPPGPCSPVVVDNKTYYPNVCTYNEAKQYDLVQNVYSWNNLLNDKIELIKIINRGFDKDHIQKDRDYFEPGDSNFNDYDKIYKKF
ncbi:MAG TPA: glycosyl hydrolase family 28-related protein, partial [Spirochaetota bacterium]|nr:glycosyl hydrolase family 28-related protein [Spirochaetota bacterium]